jgi:hypothetical protein
MNDAQLKLSSQICFPLYSASRLITKAYKPYLDEMGITYPYLVLLVLWENDGLYVNQITGSCSWALAFAITQTHGKMELLQRTRSIEDERSVVCS